MVPIKYLDNVIFRQLSGTAFKKIKTLGSGWKIATVPTKSGGSYKQWFGPDGTRYRTEGEAKDAGYNPY